MATQSKVILVTGATGQQGGAVATALLTKRQIVRDAGSRLLAKNKRGNLRKTKPLCKSIFSSF